MSEEGPPYGYDETGLISHHRMIVLIDRFEKEVSKIQQVFDKTILTHPWSGVEETDFWHLRHTAEELGPQYQNLVETLIHDYQMFKMNPTRDALSLILKDIESLKTALTA